MSLAVAPHGPSLSPTAFSERLLEAASLDGRRDPRERSQLAALLRPFTGAEVDGAAFESALQECQQRDADLSGAAREVLALWYLCSRFKVGASGPTA
jgi:hypothetical protein